MKIKHIHGLLLLTTIFTLLPAARSQTFLGLQHSNFGGIHQAGLNPANIAGSRHKMYFNGLTAGFGFNNDYLKLDLPFPLTRLISNTVPAQYKNPDGSLKFDESWLSENVNGKPKNLNLSLQTRTPGFMMSLPRGFALGIQYRNTVSFQVNDVAEPLARLARYGIDSSSGSVSYSGPNQFRIGETFGDNAFTINMNAYGEIAVTLAKTLMDENGFLIKAGATPKLLLGYASGYIKNRGLQIKAAGSDTLVFGETDLEYGYTDPGDLSDFKVANFNAFTQKLQGSGFGFDLGASFEYRGKNDDQYRYRGGISLLDGGSITYRKNFRDTRLINKSGDKYFLITPAFGQAWEESRERGIEYTDSVLRTLFTVDTSGSSIVSHMPTTLNMQFDYRLYGGFYLGANLSQDMRGKKSIGVRKASYLVLIPRFEHRFGELALPIGLMNDYKTPRLGLYLRLGPVFIGSDNLIGQLKGRQVYGLDFYFGTSFGILNKKERSSEKQ